MTGAGAAAATAAEYREFADHFARGVTPRYELFARGVADDPDVLAFLEGLPAAKRQPVLFFGAVKYLAGVLPDYAAFSTFVLGSRDDLSRTMLARSTQTNEPGRCAAWFPLLAAVEGPIALLEVGAAAGLCLLLDRYGYDYAGYRAGRADAPVVFPCEPRGPVAPPLPEAMPQIVWRRGLDRNPLDVLDPDTVSWLTALIWPDDPEREARLRAALRLASEDPPPVTAGDLLERTADLAAEAPADATLFIVHSTVMPYLTEAEQERFVGIASGIRGASWVSFEGVGVLPEIDERIPPGTEVDPGAFVLALNGEPMALASPHGRWLQWLDHR